MGGEPNNAIGGTEHCAHMGSSKYKNAWTDIPCSKSYDNFLLMCSYNLRTGIPGDVSYCTSSGPCTFGQGDCDKDTECSGSLVCGKDNCRDFNSKAEPSYDCCTNVVDGGWSSWSYGACSKTCGGGTQRGTRSCNNPRPSNGGKICAGSGVTTRQCNTKSCPGACRTGWMEFAGRCYYVAKGNRTILHSMQKTAIFICEARIRTKKVSGTGQMNDRGPTQNGLLGSPIMQLEEQNTAPIWVHLNIKMRGMISHVPSPMTTSY